MKIIKFGASWCMPCKSITPTLNKINNEFQDLEIQSIDIDDNPDMAKEFKVRSLPTLILLKNNVEIKRIVGSISENKIRTELLAQ